MNRFLSIVVLLFLLPFSTPANAQTQSFDCSQYDVWIWAQTVFEEDKNAGAALDPDGNGLACEHLPFVGFSPMPGVKSQPKNIFPVSNVQVKNDFNLTVKWKSETKTVLLHETNPLVTSTGVEACGAEQTIDFMNWVLSWIDPTNIFVEPNYGTMADYDEHQGYLWMEVAGDWYMLNDVMLRGGWAQYSDEGMHHLHQDELMRAESFASDHMLGAHLTCGGTNMASGSVPTGDQMTTAASMQPDHGQHLDATNYYDIFLAQSGPHGEQATSASQGSRTANTSETQENEYAADNPVLNAGMTSTGNGIINQPDQAAAETVYEEPAEEVWEEPVYEAPAEEVWEAPAEPVYEEPANTGCHPSYGGCLPMVGDLNCGDIGAKDIPVFGPDAYGLDSDSDGIGCES